MFKLKRNVSGPILSPDEKIPWEKEGVFNPGVVRFGDEVYMLYRAVGEKVSYTSRLGLAKSFDGVHFKRASLEPIFKPNEIFDKWATEDPRITKIDEDYYITYVAVAKRIMRNGHAIDRFLPLETSTALLKTKDFLTFQNLGVISPPNSDNKDIVLFPRKIKGRYYMLHRPNRWSKSWFKGSYEKYLNEGLPCDVENLPDTPGVWIASSTDLSNWIDHRLLINQATFFDAKTGPGLPPIETTDGWLVIYHHVKKSEDNKLIYSVRAALFELENPTQIIVELPNDILYPEESYELEADSKIVFPTGGYVKGDTLYVYYGASDRYVGLATGSLTELLKDFKEIIKEKTIKKLNKQKKMLIAFLTTYPPRECGIATFAADLIKNFDLLYAPRENTKVIALNADLLNTHRYSKKVIAQISENKESDYLAAAVKLNSLPEIKLVSIQHEFGIFGNDNGKNILIFLKEIKKPVAITFHSVLPNPNDEIKELVQKIISYADCIIVMNNISKEILETVYDAPTEKVKIIPHGIHPLSYTNGLAAKLALNLSKRKILSTFGLISPGKGIEHAIAALPEIVASFPDVLYLIIGATHPVVLRREGDVYRNKLIAQILELGMQDHVVFYNEYLETEDLLKFLQATDIYLSLSENPNQAVSGTLVYALGAGRPVISTPFIQAKELVTPEVGALVGFSDSKGIAQKAIKLFSDKNNLIKMRKTAYFRTRGMTWPNVALLYMHEFIKISPDLAKKEKNLPIFKLKHLIKLTDSFGIYQFAVLTEPDPSWGYTIDDNARALIAVCWYYQIHHGRKLENLAETYLSFIERAVKEKGGFINYFTTDKQPHDSRNSNENLEDSESRTMWALSVVASSRMPETLKIRAAKLFDKNWKKYTKIISPRAVAFHTKSLSTRLTMGNDQDVMKQLIKNADFLLELFNKNTSDNWQWLEQSLTYSNAVLPEALLLAFKATGNEKYFAAGKKALNFLISQSFQEDICVPIGQNGWFKRGEEKKIYDQQPEEVSMLVQAIDTMYNIENDKFYLQKISQTFNWFMGNNLRKQMVYTQFTGGCYDGLGEEQINLNQGAESTISYLLARLIVSQKVFPNYFTSSSK